MSLPVYALLFIKYTSAPSVCIDHSNTLISLMWSWQDNTLTVHVQGLHLISQKRCALSLPTCRSKF